MLPFHCLPAQKTKSGNSSHLSRTLIMSSQKVKLTSKKRACGDKRAHSGPSFPFGPELQISKMTRGSASLLAQHWFTYYFISQEIPFIWTAFDGDLGARYVTQFTVEMDSKNWNFILHPFRCALLFFLFWIYKRLFFRANCPRTIHYKACLNESF